jgi:formamidase
MPEVIFPIDRDLSVPMSEQPLVGHNRWHPDIPAVAAIDPGGCYRIECKDWTDEQIANTDSSSDVAGVNLDKTHMLSGPFAVNGAEPGDILVVDILDMGPFPEHEWGYTGIFAKGNGGGFLCDYYPEAAKAIWDLQGIYCSSRHLPGVRFAGLSHPGLCGCAPSHDLLAEWNRREQELIDRNPSRVTGDPLAAPQDPPLALPPLEKDALLGSLTGAELTRVAREAARTVPPRDHGGNVDIKNLSKGTRIYFPVYVEGALFSIGDLHFSQGDGEITFCGAIEMPGFIDLGFELIKGGVERYALARANPHGNPIFKPGPVEPHYSEYLMFEGICVEDGRNYYMDATVAYRRACLNAIAYLEQALGYTGEQAYLLLGAAPVEGRIGGIVDIPNCAVTIGVPLEIFDRDILPH